MARTILSVLLVAILSLTGSALAQDQDRGDRPQRGGGGGPGGGGPGGPGGGGGWQRGNFDPEQMRQRMMDGIKEQLQASDEEWQVLQPKVEQVMAAQRNARTGGRGFGAFGAGFGGGGGGWGQQREGQDETDVARASRELRTVLESESPSADEISQRLEAYRAAREKSEAELETARAELKELLTQRQEASLVLMGMLE